ncbi:MAG: DUF5666 domain-containing protein [Mycobacterium sp.]
MPVHPRTLRFAAFAITGATALSVAALSAPAPAHAEGDGAFGPITSVSGNTFEVGENTAVAFTDATKISEAIPAQLGEVTVGSCVKAGPTPDSTPADSGAITAKWVMISTAVDGKCPQRPGAAPGGPHHGVRGVVNAVAGDTITVAGDTATSTVTVTDATHFRKRQPADAQAVTAGKCAAVRGAKDDQGVLQANRVTVWASNGGACPQPGS